MVRMMIFIYTEALGKTAVNNWVWANQVVKLTKKTNALSTENTALVWLSQCNTFSFLPPSKSDVPSITAITRHSGVASESCTGSAPRGVQVEKLKSSNFILFIFFPKGRHVNKYNYKDENYLFLDILNEIG